MVRFILPIVTALAIANLPGQHVLLVENGRPTAVAVPTGDLTAGLARVIRGPSPAERARGLGTAIPAGTRLLAVMIERGHAAVTVDAGFLPLLDAARGDLELAVEQLVKTAFQLDATLTAVDLFIAGRDGVVRPLTALLAAPRPLTPPPPIQSANNVRGALAGRRIVISPGHGFYWHSSLGWTTQRGAIDGLIEDIHTAEIANRFLIPYLENLGAQVISCRERGEILRERLVDNDAGAPGYTESGSWLTSGSSGYGGGTYRFATTRTTADARATWTVPIAEDGRYPVYAWFRASANRSTDAHYEIHHTGGVTTVTVDQRRDNLTWRALGEFWFAAADGATVVLTNESANPGAVVIADTVKVGAGLGSIVRGGRTSTKPRWQECSRYWAQYSGAPPSVWNPVSSGQDNSDDVTCRPRYAEWLGADAFLSLHTNAGGGLGTSSFIYNGGATAGSTTFQSAVHSRVVADIRTHYDPGWTDRGRRQANFGEVRLLRTMPGMLLELAFHDVAGSRDHRALHDPVFRRIAGRAMARGILRYFVPGAAFPPEPPFALRVTQNGARGLRVAWEPTSGATGYAIEASPDGKGFVEVARVASPTTSWSTGPVPAGTLRAFRVRALNPSGRSMPTDVLTAGTSHLADAELLLVQGFDRLERAVKSPENTFDYLAIHGRAIRDADRYSLGFDAATNEAVTTGRVRLRDYRAVDWACGEESTRNESFNAAEQTLVRAYLQTGGRLLVTGSEVGWDLDARGSAADRAFYRSTLGVTYVADDANTYGFRPATGNGLFAGLGSGSFDDGRSGTYDVDWPDVIRATDARAQVDLVYANGQSAGITVDDPATGARIVHFGFPIETITSAALRSEIMARALRFLLAPRSLSTPSGVVPIGTTAPLTIDEPRSANRPYFLAAALATEPAIPLPGGALLPLAPDVLFEASFDPASPVFARFQGRLDASGRASASFIAPPLPQIRGLRIYVSGFTLAQVNPPVLGDVLRWVSLTLR